MFYFSHKFVLDSVCGILETEGVEVKKNILSPIALDIKAIFNKKYKHAFDIETNEGSIFEMIQKELNNENLNIPDLVHLICDCFTIGQMNRKYWGMIDNILDFELEIWLFREMVNLQNKIKYSEISAGAEIWQQLILLKTKSLDFEADKKARFENAINFSIWIIKNWYRKK